jgi:hypothetical protein
LAGALAGWAAVAVGAGGGAESSGSVVAVGGTGCGGGVSEGGAPGVGEGRSGWAVSVGAAAICIVGVKVGTRVTEGVAWPVSCGVLLHEVGIPTSNKAMSKRAGSGKTRPLRVFLRATTESVCRFFKFTTIPRRKM